jgi:hypothetical protein
MGLLYLNFLPTALSSFKYLLCNINELRANVNNSGPLTRSIEARGYGIQERVLRREQSFSGRHQEWTS